MYLFNKKSVGISIVLTIVTCGLYGIYWLACIADDINALEDNRTAPSGGMVIILTIITCGLYHVYYSYMASKRLYYLYEEAHLLTSDNAIVNVILTLASYFVPGAYIVAYAIMQNDINRYLDYRQNGTY